jgi:hypothetical protein
LLAYHLTAAQHGSGAPTTAETRALCEDDLYNRPYTVLWNAPQAGLACLASNISRILLRAGTWEGIQAAKHLEEQGVATHIILVYRYSRLPCDCSDICWSAAIHHLF